MAEHWKLQKEREWEEMVKGGHEAKIVKEADEVKKMSSYDRAMSRDTNKAVVEEHKISPGPEYYAGLRHGDWTARLRGHDHAFVQRVSNVNRQELDEESAPDVAHLTAGQLEEVMRADREASNLGATTKNLEQVTVEDAPNVSDELAPDEAGTAEFQAVKERMVRQGVANVSDEEVLRHLDAMRDNEALNEAAMRLEQLGGGGGLGSSRSAQSQ
ncbi:hypothetical protein LTS18_002887, partial [Coniosporium uncinatum]